MYGKTLLRNLFASLLALFALLSTGLASAPARDTRARRPYGQPSRIKLDHLIRSRFRGYYGKEPWRYLIIEQFYPIGWSRDGKFAYILEPGNEDCDCYVATLRIQDLRTDKILWEFAYTSEPREVSGRRENMSTFWREHRELFSGKLSEYGIEAAKPFVLLGPRISHRGDLLSSELSVRKDASSVGVGQIGKVVLRLDSRQKGRKVVYEKSYSPDAHESIVEAKAFGHLKSPYGPIAALIMIEIHYGWEGPPNTTSIRVIGANLEEGFR
jgi:hypothetical protein